MRVPDEYFDQTADFIQKFFGNGPVSIQDAYIAGATMAINKINSYKEIYTDDFTRALLNRIVKEIEA